MNKEEQNFLKRLSELSNLAYQRGIFMFTDFLSMNEQSLLHNHKKELGIYGLFGGYEFAERQMAVFVPDAPFYTSASQAGQEGAAYDYPIATLKVTAKYPKFAERLTHRDYLGAVMNLGIDRGKIGDIIVGENEAYVFCHEKMAEYLTEELSQIKHTQAEAVITEAPASITQPSFTEKRGSVASLRADSIVALAAGRSRSSVLELFRTGKIFVNGKLIESGSFLLKEGDSLTIRGVGRFKFEEVLSITKKERYSILLLKSG